MNYQHHNKFLAPKLSTQKMRVAGMPSFLAEIFRPLPTLYEGSQGVVEDSISVKINIYTTNIILLKIVD